MSGMAAEMAARMAEEGTAVETPVPGAGETRAGEQVPSAETQNTDTTPGGPPETIPYARFKEVNDRLQQLQGYEELRGYGYDPDSLGRLAQFEAAYMRDPVGTWKAMGDNLDLPQELKDAVAVHTGGEPSSDSGPAQGEPSPTPSPGAEPSPEVKELLEFKRSVEQERADRDSQAKLDQALAHWNGLDDKDKISFPEKTKLMYIAQVGRAGQFGSLEELAEAARREALELRDHNLGGVIQAGRPTGTPLAVPGSGVAATAPQKFGDIKAATAAARAAMERGELPTIGGG